MSLKRLAPPSAFTLVELLVVLAIVGFLAGISIPVFKEMRERGMLATHVSNLREISLATLRWAADHNQILPSPQYPGGHARTGPEIPEQWDFAGTGSGLWLDGVIYYAACYQRADERSDEAVGGVNGENGEHLRGTAFFSQRSYKRNPGVKDWHFHSYAMNRSLQHDIIYDSSRQPELTNKNLAKILHRPHALLFTENDSSNVIGFGDQDMIAETARKRWSSGKAISTFLDGSARTLAPHEFPRAPRNLSRESCRFWSGVDPFKFSCGTTFCTGSDNKEEDGKTHDEEEEEADPDRPMYEVPKPPPC